MARSRHWDFIALAICAVGAAAFLTFGPGDANAVSTAVDLGPTSPVPAILQLPAGGVLIWHNNDSVRHRVRSVGPDDDFDSGDLEPGETYAHAFSRPGTYVYADRRKETHAVRLGTVIVGTSSVSSPEAPSQPPPGSSAQSAPAPAGQATVDVRDFAFAPASVTVAVGATVTFRNAGAASHTATARDGSFDVTLARGASTVVTFAHAGTFAYYCKFHTSMVGSITVVAATGAGVPPTTGAAPTPSTPNVAAPAAPAPHPVKKAGAAGTLHEFRFAPAVLRVRVGQAVTWTNRGAVAHTVSALDGSFDSGVLDPGAGWTHVFRHKGVYRIACALHPQMRAAVVVLPRAVAVKSGAVKRHPRARPAKRSGTRSRARS
jgi:plastocyanin